MKVRFFWERTFLMFYEKIIYQTSDTFVKTRIKIGDFGKFDET